MTPAQTKRELVAFASLIVIPLVAAMLMLMAGPSPSGPPAASAAVVTEPGVPVVTRVDVSAAKPKADKQRHRKAEKAEKKPLAEVVNAARRAARRHR